MVDLQALYGFRFGSTGLAKRQAVWRVLCQSFFQKYVPREGAILELACGYGEFINNIAARRRMAVDMNTDAAGRLDPEVEFHQGSALDLSGIAPGSIDTVFTSNFLEHLSDKQQLDALFVQVMGVLKPGGRFVVMGPNIRFAYAEYWDFYDHYLPLSERSLAEGLILAGFGLDEVIDRFLPYTMNNSAPTAGVLIKTYLRLPIAWKILGKQFLVVARKPA